MLDSSIAVGASSAVHNMKNRTKERTLTKTLTIRITKDEWTQLQSRAITNWSVGIRTFLDQYLAGEVEVAQTNEGLKIRPGKRKP